MRRASVARLLVAALTFMGAAPARAEVRVVLSSRSEHYRFAFEGFQERWGAPVKATVLGQESALVPGDVVVAFGSRAAARAWPGAAAVVICMAPGTRPRDGEISVGLLPRPEELLGRMKKLLPGLKVLRVLWSSDYEEGDVDALSDAGARLGITVLSERVVEPRLLPETLRGFDERAGALWLMPDPRLVTARNFQVLREYARARRVPFLAPTEGLAEKGATATLAVPFRAVGRAAADALRASTRGEPVAVPYRPEGIVVVVSAPDAAQTGLDVSAASGVDRIVR